jgi:hypothetical protein
LDHVRSAVPRGSILDVVAWSRGPAVVLDAGLVRSGKTNLGFI